MIDHHIQRTIIKRCSTFDAAKYSDLKPAELEGNIFLYHLKQLIAAGFILKSDEGYSLTSKGKQANITIDDSPSQKLAEPHSVFFVAIQNTAGDWLLRKRLVQPNLNKIGFLHGEPILSRPIEQAVVGRVQQYTGLTGTPVFRGSGYIAMSFGGQLESYSHFSLFHLLVDTGASLPVESSASGKNYWDTDPNFAGQDMLPSMPDLVQRLLDNPYSNFFVDLQY